VIPGSVRGQRFDQADDLCGELHQPFLQVLSSLLHFHSFLLPRS
jgi:hypothetical protein